MDVVIQKVGERDGKERFVLVQATSGDVITAKDASEGTIRKYFRAKGLSNGFLDECFQKTRARFNKQGAPKRTAASPTPASPIRVGPATAGPGAAKPVAAKPAAMKPAAKPDPAPAAADDDDFLFELGLEE